MHWHYLAHDEPAMMFGREITLRSEVAIQDLPKVGPAWWPHELLNPVTQPRRISSAECSRVRRSCLTH